MRIAALVSALAVVAALSAPAFAQERTDWSVITAFKATGKTCLLRFAAPKGGISLTMEHSPAKGKRPARAVFKLGGLPPYLEAAKASLRGIRLSVESGWARGALKGDWRKGAGESDSRVQFALPYEDMLGAIAKSWTLKVETTFGVSNSQAYTFDLHGSSAPIVAYSACIANAG